jgi:outer membrane lipoprotein SlyB
MTASPLPRLAALLALGALTACGSSYSANEYAARAVQQANPVQQGTVVGSRRVAIAAGGETGATAGAAAGGAIGGAAAAGNSVSTALGAVGGALLGSLVGTAAERTTANTDAVEYIIRKNSDGELISVTQRDPVPIPLGTAVLVIAGNQARVVPDYIASQAEPPARAGQRRPASPRAPDAPMTPIGGQGPSPQPATPPPAPVAEPLPPAVPALAPAPDPAPVATPAVTAPSDATPGPATQLLPNIAGPAVRRPE